MLAAVCTAGALSPGPSLLFVLATRARHGAQAAVRASIGHGVGVGVYAMAAVWGVATVTQSHPLVARTIETVGALYLLWLAWGVWPRGDGSESLPQAATDTPTPAHRSFVQGFLVAFLNPKVMVFFVGIFAALAPATASWGERSGMGLMAATIDAAWYALVSLAGGAVSGVFAHCTVQRMIAALLAAFGLALLLP